MKIKKLKKQGWTTTHREWECYILDRLFKIQWNPNKTKNWVSEWPSQINIDWNCNIAIFCIRKQILTQKKVQVNGTSISSFFRYSSFFANKKQSTIKIHKSVSPNVNILTPNFIWPRKLNKKNLESKFGRGATQKVKIADWITGTVHFMKIVGGRC